MSNPLSAQEALYKAAASCSTRELCAYDIFEKLKKWGIEGSDASQIITHLTQQGFINERRYAKGFINDKFRFNKWGKIKIAYGLRQKRISEEIIEESLRFIDDELYQNTLLEILENKRKSLKAIDKRDMEAKLFRFAASRGFESNIIQSVIRSMKL